MVVRLSDKAGDLAPVLPNQLLKPVQIVPVDLENVYMIFRGDPPETKPCAPGSHAVVMAGAP